jgi:hypothetical protein
MSTTSRWYDQVEHYEGVSFDGFKTILDKSQAISLKRIADALEIIAAKPPIDPEELGRQINTAIVEGGYTIARHMRGQ